MTDKSAAAIREFAEYMSGWILPNDPTVVGNIMIQLTALIEEHYVSREEHEKLVEDYQRLLEQYDSLIDCDDDDCDTDDD